MALLIQGGCQAIKCFQELFGLLTLRFCDLLTAFRGRNTRRTRRSLTTFWALGEESGLDLTFKMRQS